MQHASRKGKNVVLGGGERSLLASGVNVAASQRILFFARFKLTVLRA
jgi:hypothetical protein